MQPEMSRADTFGAPVFLPRGVPGFIERGPGNPRQNDSTSDNRVIGVFPAGETPGTAAEHLQVVLNWFEELKTRVPTQ